MRINIANTAKLQDALDAAQKDNVRSPLGVEDVYRLTLEIERGLRMFLWEREWRGLVFKVATHRGRAWSRGGGMNNKRTIATLTCGWASCWTGVTRRNWSVTNIERVAAKEMAYFEIMPQNMELRARELLAFVSSGSAWKTEISKAAEERYGANPLNSAPRVPHSSAEKGE